MHHRKSIRLQGYDYSRPGFYFITICSYKQEEIFCSIMDEKVHLTDIGNVIMRYWQEIPEHFQNVTLDYWVIMPNHIHGILVINEINSAVGAGTSSSPYSHANQFQHIIPKSIGTIVRKFKALVTIQSRKICPEIKIWQRNYWEHIIRDANELSAIRQYIQNNPLNWHLDSLNGKNRPK